MKLQVYFSSDIYTKFMRNMNPSESQKYLDLLKVGKFSDHTHPWDFFKNIIILALVSRILQKHFDLRRCFKNIYFFGATLSELHACDRLIISRIKIYVVRMFY